MRLSINHSDIEKDKKKSFLSNVIENIVSRESKKEKIEKNNSLRIENTIYQVIQKDVNGVYLQNTDNNIVQKETKIDRKILSKIDTDTILEYKNAKYTINEELTDKFYNSLVSIKELEDIKNNFEKENINIIKDIDNNETFILKSKEDNKVFLEREKTKELFAVDKALVPFFSKLNDILYYDNRCFIKNKKDT